MASVYPLALLSCVTALVALLVRVPFFDWALTADEGGYAYGATQWFRGGLTMYSDELWFDRPQGIFVAYEVGLRLFGDSVAGIRAIGAVWSAGTAVLVALIGAQLFDRRVAWLAGLGYAVVSGAPQVEGFITNAEIFMLLPGTAAVWSIWRRRYLAAGLLIGLAVLLKPSGAPLVLFAAIWMFGDREGWRSWLWLAVGFAVFPLASLVHGLVTVGLHDYLYPVALFRLEAGSTSSTGLRFLQGWYFTAPVWFPLVLVSVPGWRALAGTRERRFLNLWLLSALAGMAMGGNWFEHYMLQMLPPLVLIAAHSVVYIVDELNIPRRLQAIPGAGVVAAAAAALVLPWVVEGPVDGADRLFRGNPGYAVNAAVGEYLAANTTADESVYVAVAQADIVYLSGRRSGIPYLYLQQVAEREGTFQEIVDHIDAAEPAYVVLMHHQFSGSTGIHAALTRRYVHDRWFGEVEVFRRQSDSTAAAGVAP